MYVFLYALICPQHPLLTHEKHHLSYQPPAFSSAGRSFPLPPPLVALYHRLSFSYSSTVRQAPPQHPEFSLLSLSALSALPSLPACFSASSSSWFHPLLNKFD